MSDGDNAPGPTHALDDEVLTDFGHQLRNQLNAMGGAAGLLPATATSSDQRELASIVLTGSEQLAGLVDEVLDSELIQSGNFELALHPFNLRSSAEACLSRISGTAASKGITITFRVAADTPTVVIGDSRRVEQVLYAMLRLAVERTEQGGIDVELTSEPNEGPLKLRFRIHDAGLTFSTRVLEAGLGDAAPLRGLGPGERLAALSLQTTKPTLKMMDGALDIRHTGADGSAVTEIDFTFLAMPSGALEGAGES